MSSVRRFHIEGDREDTGEGGTMVEVGEESSSSSSSLSVADPPFIKYETGTSTPEALTAVTESDPDRKMVNTGLEDERGGEKEKCEALRPVEARVSVPTAYAAVEYRH
jgi:hypothetical protein